MSRYDDVMARILSGVSDANIPFQDLRQLLLHLGFEERIRGDHHIFTRDGIADIINLQPKRAKAKPYQVKQVRNLILMHKLGAVSND